MATFKVNVIFSWLLGNIEIELTPKSKQQIPDMFYIGIFNQ